ncbi:MAG TPA: Npun_R2821/Npun_R2822 family protein [Coleofasciculaceae cyanobacterium]
MDGICTLANDQVYHQLVALLNSIEAFMGSDMPVCVYPYDDNTSQIAAEIARRPNVQLYADQGSIARWDDFVRRVWDTHPTARQRWKNSDPNFYYRVGTHRRLCAFDAPFDRWLYMDADTILLNSVSFIFNQLEQQDWITYDFQFKDLSHVYEVSSPRLTQLFSPKQLQSEIFCSGFYAAKTGLFEAGQRNWLISELHAGDAEVLYPMAPDQTLLNYMVMKSVF